MDILHGLVLKDSSDLAEVASGDMSELKELTDYWDANGRVQIEQKIATLSVKSDSQRSSRTSFHGQRGSARTFWTTLLCCFRRQFNVTASSMITMVVTVRMRRR